MSKEVLDQISADISRHLVGSNFSEDYIPQHIKDKILKDLSAQVNRAGWYEIWWGNGGKTTRQLPIDIIYLSDKYDVMKVPYKSSESYFAASKDGIHSKDRQFGQYQIIRFDESMFREEKINSILDGN